MNLVNQATKLLHNGIHDPEEMFWILYRKNRVHYSQVREAIHIAKGK